MGEAVEWMWSRAGEEEEEEAYLSPRRRLSVVAKGESEGKPESGLSRLQGGREEGREGGRE